MTQHHSRQRHRELAQSLTNHHVVLGVDVLPTADGPITEAAVREERGGVPPRVLREIADQGMSVRSVSPRGDSHYVVECV